MKAHSYHPSKIRPFAQIIARMVQNNPNLAEDPERLWANMVHQIPELADRSVCPNCKASMAEYADTLDINDALLILNMARIVNRKVAAGINFTEANKLRVSSEDIHHTQKCRTTKCSKLGLIAKAGNAQWSITKRGWAALKGEPVPKIRVTFRKQILERPEDMTTLSHVFAEHRSKMQTLQNKKKALKNDKRSEFDDYDQSQWVHVVGLHQGELL